MPPGSTGSGSVIADPRIEEGVRQVGDQVDHHHDRGEEQVDAGNHGVVALVEGTQHEAAEPREIEDVLDDDRAAGDDGQLQRHEGHHRDEGVLHSVAQHHPALLKALGPGGPHVVLAQNLQHHRARHAHGARCQVSPQNQRGDDEYAQIGPGVFAETDVGQRRRPAPPDGWVDHHHQSEPEVGGRQAEDGDRPPGVVGHRVLANRRVDADRHGDDESGEDRQQSQLDRDPGPAGELLLHRGAGRRAAVQRVAEGAAQDDVTDPLRVLRVDGFIEPEPFLQSLGIDRTAPAEGHPCGHYVDDVAGDEADREKHQDGDDEQGRDYQQYPPDHIRPHLNSPRIRTPFRPSAPGRARAGQKPGHRLGPAGTTRRSSP